MAYGLSLEVRQLSEEPIFRVDFNKPGEKIAWAEANLPEVGFIAAWQTPFSIEELIPIIERCAAAYEADFPDLVNSYPMIIYAHDGRKGVKQERAVQRPLDWDQIIDIWETKEVWFVKIPLPMGTVVIQRQGENDLGEMGVWVDASDSEETMAAFSQLFVESKGEPSAKNEADIFFNAVLSQFWREESA